MRERLQVTAGNGDSVSRLKARDSNVEFLRILAMLGVIVLHYNNPTIGGGLTYADGNLPNTCFLYGMEALFVCAVDLFILISGYFMATSYRRSIGKPLELVVQMTVFAVLCYLGSCAHGVSSFSVGGVVGSLLPRNYFVVLYVALYFASPYINRAMMGLSAASLRRMVIVLGVAFMVYPEAVDLLSELVAKRFVGMSTIGMYGSQWGYTIVNFSLMYVIGAYLKLSGGGSVHFSSQKLIAALVAVVFILAIWGYADSRIGYEVEPSGWEYCNPLVAIEAVLVFTLIKRVDLGTNSVINVLAKGSFTVFLVHGFLLEFVEVAPFASGNPFFLMLHLLCVCVVVYLVCWVVWVLYDKATAPLWRMVRPALSRDVIGIDDGDR